MTQEPADGASSQPTDPSVSVGAAERSSLEVLMSGPDLGPEAPVALQLAVRRRLTETDPAKVPVAHFAN